MIEFRFARHHLTGLAVITTPDPTKYIKLGGNSTGHCPKSENPNEEKKFNAMYQNPFTYPSELPLSFTNLFIHTDALNIQQDEMSHELQAPNSDHRRKKQ